MSEAFSVESEDLIMDLKKKDLQSNGSLKKTPSVKQFSERTIREGQFSQMLTQWTIPQLKQLTLQLEDSHAKTFLKQGKGKESKVKGQDSGKLIKKVLGFYDQKSQSLKTYQCCISEDSMLSLLTLPKWGMMQNGLLYQLKRLGHSMYGRDFSLLPTLVSSDSFTCDFKSTQVKQGSRHSLRLHQALLPTIGACEYKGLSKKRFRGSQAYRGAKMSEGLRTSKEGQIYLNPYFAEAVMGFPIGWTELKVVETQLSRKSDNLLQEESKRL